MIAARGLSRTFCAPNFQVRAVRGVDLEVAQGQFVAVLGPSGSGKTTLLNILGLIDRPNRGRYWFDGVEVSGFAERQLAALRRDRIGFIFQTHTLIDRLTVRQNVELGLTYSRVPPSERSRRTEDAMDWVGIGHRAECRASDISAIEQRRAEVARAIVRRPKILFADEPAVAQDGDHGCLLMRMLRALNSAGTTIVLATHSRHFAAFADEIVYMDDGERSELCGSGVGPASAWRSSPRNSATG